MFSVCVAADVVGSAVMGSTVVGSAVLGSAAGTLIFGGVMEAVVGLG